MYQGTGGVDTIVSLLNELLKTIYNPKGTLGLTVSYENVDLNDNYDNGASAGTLKSLRSPGARTRTELLLSRM